jgi:hypothetical protein
MIIFFLLGVLVLAVMAFAAHSLAYFPGDVAISHVVQSSNSDWLDTALTAISWLGFPPQSDVLFGVIVVVLFVCGARWAAVTEALAAIGSGGLYLLLEHFVGQPRPTGDLLSPAACWAAYGWRWSSGSTHGARRDWRSAASK